MNHLLGLTLQAREIAQLCHGLPTARELRVVLREDQNTEFFCTVRDPNRDAAKLQAFVDEARPLIPADWVLRATQSDAVIRPRFLTKGSAITWLYEHRLSKPDCIIGLGDRDDDKDFLGLCDYVVLPQRSTLWAALSKETLDVGQ